jgi:two-component system, OmpR family, sensor histidine kinase ArlS
VKIEFPNFGRISWKLTVIYAFMFSFVLLMLSAGVLYGVKFYLLQQAREQVQNSTTNTINMILDNDSKPGHLKNSELLDDANIESDINIIIAQPNRKIVNSSNNYTILKDNIFEHPGEIRQYDNNGTRLLLQNSTVKDKGVVVAYLQVALSMKSNYNFMQLLFSLLAVADSLGIILSVFVGYAVSKRMLKPIDRITRTATSISINDLDKRIPVGEAQDEISRLAMAFNDMIERLKKSVDRQNQFVSDASHELRTPISVIQGYINLVDRWGKDNKSVLQESITAIKGETANMHALIEKLLFLARTDRGQMKARREDFNMGELMQEIADETKMISPDTTIAVEADGALVLSADRNLMKQVLRNLVDNGVKYALGASEINLRAERAGNKVRIMVDDNGSGISQEDVNKIFDRFYLVDKARSKDTGGSGLGLAIVKNIVDIHNGEINVKSEIGKGTSITITLPGEKMAITQNAS